METESIEYNNEYLLQFQDIFLEIMTWSPELWWKICIVFKNIGLYSINKRIHVQKYVKKLFSRPVEKIGNNNFRIKCSILPCGTKHGEYKKYYPPNIENPQITIGVGNLSIKKEKIYKDGKKHGKCKDYDENGFLKRSVYYENGIMHGKFKIYLCGRLLEKRYHFYGIIHGEWTEYLCPTHNNEYELEYNKKDVIIKKEFYNMETLVDFILEIKPIKYPVIVTSICKIAYIWLYGPNKENLYYCVDYDLEYYDESELVEKNNENLENCDFYITPTSLRLCGFKSSEILQKYIKQYKEFQY
jgi:antitoxin component YwqK of YwqJK toxin-antitoxin module